MTQHTPGPWRIDTDGKGHYMVRGDGRGANVCLSFDSNDARLIAAAPEMLQTITDLSDILTDYIRYAQEMRKIGRGYSTVDTAGRVDENVLAGARALLARIEGKE